MKKVISYIFLFIFTSLISIAQVQIDNALEFTGSGSFAKITGIEEVNGPEDAMNVQSAQNNSVTYALATNISDAFSVTLTPAPAYTIGLIVHFKSQANNNGPTTLDVNLLGPLPIKKNFNTDLAANDIKNGQMVSVMYDGSSFQMLSQLGNASGGTATCPAGYQNAGLFCIETNERTAANWTNANNTCSAANARLCSPGEWKYACNNTGTIPVTNMTNSAREWSGTLAYTTACDCARAIAMGYAGQNDTGGTSGCNVEGNFNSYAARDMSTSYAYRCCKDK